jgi:tRNA 2-thiouridine synthesizing protein B
MLHIISSAPISLSILRRIDAGDAVLFIDNAVLMLNENTDLTQQLIQLSKTARLHVLVDDLQIRGIDPKHLVAGITRVDYQGFVNLTVEHELIQSWH